MLTETSLYSRINIMVYNIYYPYPDRPPVSLEYRKKNPGSQ